MACDGCCERLQVRFGIRRVIHTWAPVETAVEELVPAACGGGCGDPRWVGCCSGNVELLEETICFRREPGGVAGFDDGWTEMVVTKHCEEGFGCSGVEDELWRKLEEDRTELRRENSRFCEKVR